MICPHCNLKIETVTDKQIEAYRCCFLVGLTQKEAAEVIGITQQAISRLLCRLKEQRPELFEHEQHRINHKHLLTYNDELMQDKVVKQW